MATPESERAPNEQKSQRQTRLIRTIRPTLPSRQAAAKSKPRQRLGGDRAVCNHILRLAEMDHWYLDKSDPVCTEQIQLEPTEFNANLYAELHTLAPKSFSREAYVGMAEEIAEMTPSHLRDPEPTFVIAPMTVLYLLGLGEPNRPSQTVPGITQQPQRI